MTNNNIPRRGSSFSIASMGATGSSNGAMGGAVSSNQGRHDNHSQGGGGNERTLSMFKKYLRPLTQPDLEEESEESQRKRQRRDNRRDLLQKILSARAYKIIVATCSVLLLAGAQIRDLWLPKEADVAVDAVFCVLIVFFLGDMAMRIDSEPNYFHFSFCFRP